MKRILFGFSLMLTACGGGDDTDVDDTDTETTDSDTDGGTTECKDAAGSLSPDNLTYTVDVGSTGDDVITVSNDGCGDLTLNSFYTTNPSFTVDASLVFPIEVLNGTTMDFTITATAELDRPESGVLSFEARGGDKNKIVEIGDVLAYLN